MRRIALALLSATALTLVAAQSASAASATYNWNGFYVGGHVGWGWNNAEGDTYIRTTGAFRGSGEVKWDGFLGGAQLGFNWMVRPNIVLGIEADVSFPTSKANISVTSAEGTADKEYKLTWIGTVRGRVGYAFNNWMFYGTGGVAWTHFSFYNIQVTCGPANPTCLAACRT